MSAGTSVGAHFIPVSKERSRTKEPWLGRSGVSLADVYTDSPPLSIMNDDGVFERARGRMSVMRCGAVASCFSRELGGASTAFEIRVTQAAGPRKWRKPRAGTMSRATVGNLSLSVFRVT